MAHLGLEARERGKRLFYEYLYRSRTYFTDTENNERRLQEIDWELADLELTISVDEENSEKHEDPERGIDILAMPACLITLNKPLVVIEQDVLIHIKQSDSLPMQPLINEGDIRFLRGIGINIRI